MKYLCLVYLDENRLDELSDADCGADHRPIRETVADAEGLAVLERNAT